MKDLLSDESTYKKLSTNPTNRVLRKINGMLDEWHNKGYIDGRTQRRLKESSCNPPRIYGLPKTHKENRPLRPVVSTIGSATYNIAKYLSDIIGFFHLRSIHLVNVVLNHAVRAKHCANIMKPLHLNSSMFYSAARCLCGNLPQNHPVRDDDRETRTSAQSEAEKGTSKSSGCNRTVEVELAF
nr:uncharacterized protein LOC115266693 [Aedes albopictus]